MIVFNRVDKIMVDVQNSIADNSVKINTSDGSQLTVDIDYDKVINSIRDDYFDAFIKIMILEPLCLLMNLNN